VVALTTSANSNVAHAAQVVLADSLLRERRVEEALQAARAQVDGPALLSRRQAAGVEARCYLELGRYAEALRAAERGLADGGACSFPQCYLDLVNSRAEALIALREVSEARTAVSAAARFRARCAGGITDPTVRAAFATRGSANQRLDKLVDALLPQGEASI
jgi:hypothetical protein